MCTLGIAAEVAAEGIAANCLWPRTLINTAAVRNVIGGADKARSPEIVADAAHAILGRPARECTGNVFMDDEVLAAEGITDLSTYGPADVGSLTFDIFVDQS